MFGSLIADNGAIDITVIARLTNGAPAALDTLEELADALGDDANYAATITTALALKAPLASPALTGNPTVPTQAANNNSTRAASTAYVDTADALKANLASPTFTGTPAVPTAAVDTNTTQAASTAYVLAQAAAATPIIDGTGAVGTSTRYARADHVHPTDTSRQAQSAFLDSLTTAGLTWRKVASGSTVCNTAAATKLGSTITRQSGEVFMIFGFLRTAGSAVAYGLASDTTTAFDVAFRTTATVDQIEAYATNISGSNMTFDWILVGIK
jgi:hypothetical protein